MVSFFGAFLDLFLGLNFGGFSFDLGSGNTPIGLQGPGHRPSHSTGSGNTPIG